MYFFARLMAVRVVIKSQVSVSNASAIFERQTLTTNERTENRSPPHPDSNENMFFLAQFDRKSIPELYRKHDFFSPNRPKIDPRVLTKT